LSLRDRVALSVEAGLVGVVGDGLGLAIGVGVGVGTADDHYVMGLVVLIKSLFQFTVLRADDAILSLEATR
jgi:hypothetical protein